MAGLEYPLYFQFNDDYSWSESLVVRLDTNVVAKGIYSYTSNNTFNLIYPDASPARKKEPCNIISLTNTSFIFSKQLPTVFNGTDPGYIKYVFRLTKMRNNFSGEINNVLLVTSKNDRLFLVEIHTSSFTPVNFVDSRRCVNAMSWLYGCFDTSITNPGDQECRENNKRTLYIFVGQ